MNASLTKPCDPTGPPHHQYRQSLDDWGVRMNEDEDDTVYRVVINHEEQYSIWPADRPNPAGRRDAGCTGPKADCLAYIEQNWTDMRPLSVRQAMARAAS
jgi:MbtH protein